MNVHTRNWTLDYWTTGLGGQRKVPTPRGYIELTVHSLKYTLFPELILHLKVSSTKSTRGSYFLDVIFGGIFLLEKDSRDRTDT